MIGLIIEDYTRLLAGPNSGKLSLILEIMISKLKMCLYQIRFDRCAMILFFTITTIVMFSCVSQRKVEYIQDSVNVIRTFKEPELTDYRLKSNDELFIQINSLDETAISIFSGVTTQRAEAIDQYSASLLSHLINKDGYLNLPVIGSIYAKDKTLSEVSLILKDSLQHILNQPIVTVKLVNRYVSVLGEVRMPGHYPYFQEKFTLLDAISLAGDITDYGDPNNVILVRNERGENKRINMNLTRSEMLESEYYYIRPNDIIYIKPQSNKFWRIRQIPLSILFSTITTGLLIYNIFR